MRVKDTLLKRKELIALALCLLIGFALRYYSFDKKSLWVDEIHTYNDSRDGLRDQIKFYKENPAFFHPPLFFLLTHLFYPFPHPERDLRIIPLIFGTLSIPMIYLLARSFSNAIAIPCAISLTLMTYHISLSQDGRSYSLLMFLGMASLYFFIRYLKTFRKRYLFPAAVLFAVLFHTSYSAIPFIIFSQVLWLYQAGNNFQKPSLFSFFLLSSLVLLLCAPWITFLAFNYAGETLMDPFHTESPGSFFSIFYGVFHDWVPYAPLMVVSLLLFILFPFFSGNKKNTFILLSLFIFPIGGLYSFCELFKVTHFVTSRYFITFLPVFFVIIFLSLEALEIRFPRLKRVLRLTPLFLFLFTASNLVILPLYYRSEKQDIRSLTRYLKAELREGDKIFDAAASLTPGILHYLGAHPQTRHHIVSSWIDSENKLGFRISFSLMDKKYTIFHSKTCCSQYITEENRLWIIVGKGSAKEFKKNSPCVLKGYFDGSFLNLSKFPEDASIYLFLWDPKSYDKIGLELPIE